MAEEIKEVVETAEDPMADAISSILASEDILSNPEAAKALAEATASIKAQLGLNIPEEVLLQIGILFTLPDDKFEILGNEFCAAFEKSLNNPADKINICQMLNISNVKAEDLLAAQSEWNNFVESSFNEEFTPIKKSFLKKLFGIIVNAVMDAEGVSKRIVNVPIELNEDGTIPTYAVVGDAGADVYAACDIEIQPGDTVIVPTGIKVEIPIGYEIQVRPRSGLSAKSKLRIANAPGTIDSNYRGEIGIICENIAPKIKNIIIDPDTQKISVEYNPSEFIEKGQRIAQLVLSEVPTIHFEQVEKISTVIDRKGGFGSTGA